MPNFSTVYIVYETLLTIMFGWRDCSLQNCDNWLHDWDRVLQSFLGKEAKLRTMFMEYLITFVETSRADDDSEKEDLEDIATVKS